MYFFTYSAFTRNLMSPAGNVSFLIGSNIP